MGRKWCGNSAACAQMISAVPPLTATSCRKGISMM